KLLSDRFDMGTPWQLQADLTLFEQAIPMFLCPTDPNSSGPGRIANFNNVKRTRLNYAANHARWTDPVGSALTTAERRERYAGMFLGGHKTSNGVISPKPFSPSNISDGLSKTLCMGEVLIPSPDASTTDSRADGYDQSSDKTFFHTVFTPNSSTVDRPQLCGLGASKPERNMPCQTATSSNIHGARSLHPGTVQTLFGDGSVKGVAEAIDLSTWQALGTSNAGDVVGDY
ncbi:MAG: DUF1559 domain-containing protein, partial [Pirellulales bacterium]